MPKGIWRTVACVAAAAATLAVPAVAAAPTGIRAEVALQRAILAEINAVRKAHRLAPLRLSGGLTRAAEGHSLAMARLGFFSHSSRDGTVFWKRISRSYPYRGYATWTVGENLLWSSSRLDGATAVRMWLNSPPHRKVLLGARWRELGISAVRADAAPGAFGGSDVTLVTADFGLRR
ncbi:MAG: CAP domain-containing protein [Thermoleophilia bacterium]|nr:CAP domain-containing protein [Thermoleophilia bacterium]